MLDIKWIRDNPEAMVAALEKRGSASEAARATVDGLIALDEARRAQIVKVEEAQARRNAASKEIGKAKAARDEATAEVLMAEVSELKRLLGGAEEEGKRLDKALDDALAVIPNVPFDDVPVGADEHANVEKSRWGTRPTLNAAREHYELGDALGMMDFETAAKLSGSRFVVLRKGLARMERALGQFMLDLHTTEHGYEEVQPPLLVRDETMFGTAQLPKFVDDQFLATRTINRAELLSDALRFANEVDGHAYRSGEIDLAALVARTLDRAPLKEDFWLIPTAEVPLTNLVRESILEEDALPLRFTALTPCFRAEAGAAGRDTRGMLRQHQFDKVELVSITTPEESRNEHERMLACAEEVLRRLDLHYRVMTLSTGDMGFGAQKTYDIEVWLPGQGTFREISSCSVCGDFQARRMKARFRPREGKGNRLVHTLNGSGTAVGRALIAVMENYQNPDGSITVPDVLRPYMGGLERVSVGRISEA
jgi:seryl-tRNA synthetase